MIAVTGYNTTIVKELSQFLPKQETVVRLGDHKEGTCNRYLLAAGVLHNKRIVDQADSEAQESMRVNALGPIRSCELILLNNPKARICIIGSKAGEAGSYDQVYAAAKAGVHNYVRNARITGDQQIVCIAPTIIMDSGMTQRRNEDGMKSLRRRVSEHPKERFLKAKEVARLVYFLLYLDEGYITNTVIEMKGGPGWW
jgi:NAD(P)-dependent dehydrogenase (short-subunit alcohol dehydrogenase family)